ncbi:MAG: SIMPL domain-containing protein [Candidatus ainarchaeum sp.]|nr:SIMPL domain-containing protein [Candidatus ainarchaeum sp.]
MEVGTKHYYVLFIVLIILVALIGTMSMWGGEKKDITVYTGAENDKTISVNGSADKKVMPDEGYVNFTIETTNDKAKDAQNKNAEIWDALKLELDKKSYLKYETSNYSVYPDQKWNKETQEYETKGYKVRHSIKITLSDTSKLGEIVDLLVGAGVNDVDSISFGLKKETQETIKDELWAVAFADAKAEAETVVDAAGANLTKTPKSIQINNYNYYPSYYEKAAGLSMMDSVAAETSISPKELEVSVSLSVIFSYE